MVFVCLLVAFLGMIFWEEYRLAKMKKSMDDLHEKILKIEAFSSAHIHSYVGSKPIYQDEERDLKNGLIYPTYH